MTLPVSIPGHWRSGNIRRFAQMKTGHTPSRSVPEYWENVDIPWFTLADVWQLREGKQVYLGETANRISLLGLANSAAELLPAGTVVLSRTASVGFSGIMPRPMATSQDFWNWVCGPDLLPRYLNYQFKTMMSAFKALNVGSTHQTIYQRDAASLKILVPPITEQRAIVDYLDRETAKIDTLIAKQEQLIATLRERRRSVIARATGWGSQTRGGWRSLRISWLFAETASGTTPAPEHILDPSDGSIPWVTTGELKESLIRGTRKAVSPASVAEYSALKVHPAGSLLLAMYGATIGRLAILGIDATSNQACCALVGPRRVTAEFARYSLMAGRQWLIFDAAGGGQPNINQDKVRSFRIPVPPIDEQRAITTYLDEQTAKIDALSAKTEKFIELAKERRTALIAAAVTGQIESRASA
ncbi:restriction endonuclease subunit S [uncultured Nocardioides sp.]|uniref:restriction endonuclease subunit S n=1 Tax=Nocardioides sp. 31GB23 TaxID=3156065 RepID=UPI0030F6A9A2